MKKKDLMTVLDECLIALGLNTTVLPQKEGDEIFEEMIKKFPMTYWGRIDWDKIKKFTPLASEDEIAKCLDIGQAPVYILWDKATLPVVKTTLDKILTVLDDVTSVSYNTWIYSPTKKYVIEFFHEGEITIGWSDN